MADPFQFIVAEAGTISPLQEEKLRRCRFLRQPLPKSPTPSEKSEEEEGALRFRVSAHPISMRSASESSGSSSGDGETGEVRASEETKRGKKRLHAFADEITKDPEVVCFSPADRGNLEDGGTRSRKLPSSFRERGDQNTVGEQSGVKLLQSEAGLIDLLVRFSKEDKKLENVDFLEVLSMKGMSISPRWWRSGGYN